jgi:hypothetical protein
MLRALDDWLWGKRSSPAGKRRVQRVRLGLEMLETRELLSATPLPPNAILPAANQPLVANATSVAVTSDGTVYALESNGDLYDATTGVQMDSGVSSFAVAGNGMVVDLRNGRLAEQTAAGSASAWTDLDDGVSSFAVAGNGMVVDLRNGRLAEQTAAGSASAWTDLDDGVSSFAVAGNGMVVDLKNDGSLYRYASGSSVPAEIGKFGLTSTLCMDPGGSAMVLDSSDGSLYRLAPGSNSLNRIGKFGLTSTLCMDPGGSAMVLDSSDGSLYRLDPGSNVPDGGKPMATGVVSLAMGDDGNAYYLQNGSLYEASNGEVIHSYVLGMAQGPGGQIYVEIQYGSGAPVSLYLYNPITGNYSGLGVVQGFAVGGDGYAYFLQNGSLINATSGTSLASCEPTADRSLFTDS